MTVVPVRETSFPGSGSFLLNTPITLTGTPSAGATLIFSSEANLDPATIASIAGCGATWTKVARISRAAGTPSSVSELWVGTGCSGTGNVVTVTAAPSTTISFRANVSEWTGLAGTFDTPTTASGLTAAVASGFVMPVAVGDLVVSVMGDANNGTITPTDTPAAFTTLATAASSTYRNASAWRIATTLVDHGRTWAKPIGVWTAITASFPAAGAAGGDLVGASTASDVALSASLTATLGLSAATGGDVTLSAVLTGIATPAVDLVGSTSDDVTLSADLTVTPAGMVLLGTASTGSDVALAATLNLDLIHLLPWTADTPGKLLLDIVLSDTELQITPPVVAGDAVTGLPPVGALALPPAAHTERVLTRCSITVPSLTPDADGIYRGSDAVYDAYARVTADVGVPHVLINNVDVTYYKGRATQLNNDRQAEPFGDTDASVSFPQIPPFGARPSWLFPGAPMEIVMVTPAGTMLRLWAGHLLSDDSGNDQSAAHSTWTAQGSLLQALWFGHRVPTILDSTDIGIVIPKALNGVVSRRYSTIAQKATGIPTTQRGTDADSELSYVQGLLATAWTAAGLQWTIAKKANTARAYELILKNRTTVDYTVTVGARGVEVDLSRDLTSTVNVIFGRGIGPDGLAWYGTVYPGIHPDTAPAYPYASASTVMSIGDTDAGTLSGTGVSDWQRRVNELNLTSNVVVDGVFSSADAAVARGVQDAMGLLVDGIVGPQTWAATFSVGSDVGSLASYRKPLAIDPRVEPNLYDAIGNITGPNPVYDASIMRIERDIDYGTDITRAQATESAVRELARDLNPGLTGTVTISVDPRECSRWLMASGRNLNLIGYQGGNPVLRIAALVRDWQGLRITMEVDEHARDAMTLASIRERNREARKNPGRKPGGADRRSSIDSDVATPFDGDSRAGIIPRMALYGGLYSVIRIPVSQVGRIASFVATTSGPKSEFWIGLFGCPITPAHLVANAGSSPLVGSNPMERTEAKADALDALGYIVSFGNEGAPAGHWPRSDGPVTGRLKETGTFEYTSQKPPDVWVAIYSPTSCFIEARMRPAPNQ